MKKGKLKGTLVFWAWVWLGPAALTFIGLWWQESILASDDLSMIYSALAFMVLPASSYIGALWAVKASGRRHECVKLNCMVAFELMTVYALSYGVSRKWAECCSYIITVVICGAMAWRESKLAKIEEPEEPEKPKEKNTKRQDNYLVLMLLTLVVAILAFAIGVEVGKTKVDLEKLTIDGRSIVDVVELVSDNYGMTPQEACGIIDEYNYGDNHGGYTWDEYINAIEAAISTAGYFPPME